LCQRKLQKLAIEVTVQGLAESTGQSVRGCRRRTLSTSVEIWYISLTVVYTTTPTARGARGADEVWIEEHVACSGVKRRTGALHDVDCDVVHGKLGKQLEGHRGE